MKEIISMFTSRELFIGVVAGLTSSFLIWLLIKIIRFFKENDIKSILWVFGYLLLVIVAPIALSVVALKFLTGFLLWLVLIVLFMFFIGGIIGIAIAIIKTNEINRDIPDNKLK